MMESKYDLDAEHFVKTLQSIRVTLDGFFSEPETLADRVKLTKTRDALLIAQARAECAERMRDELERVAEGTNLEYWVESLSDELSAAITQGAQGQIESEG